MARTTKQAGSTLGSQPSEMIRIAALKRTAAKITIIGDTPLIVHAWSHKAKLMMLAKHMGKSLDRFEKDPYEDFIQSMYRFDDGNYGFPVVAVKEAMATVTADLQDAKRAQVYRNVTVTGRRGFQIGVFADLQSPHELMEIFSPNPPAPREDMVRLSGISRDPDIRYRAEFWPWAAQFTLAFDESIFDRENLMNLLARSGFSCGLGEWRQEKGGSNGLFHPATLEEANQVERWKKAGHKEPKVIDSKAWLEGVIAKMPTKEERRARAAKAVPSAVVAGKTNGKGKKGGTTEILGRYGDQ